MGNNFEVVQCTLLNKLISLDLDLQYFKNSGQVVIMEWMLDLFFRNMWKEEGEAVGQHCYKSGCISLFTVLSLFLSFSCCLLVFLFFSIWGNRFKRDGILCNFNCLLMFAFACSSYIYCCLCNVHLFCAGRKKLERPLHAVSLLLCHRTINTIILLQWNGCTCDSPKEAKGEMTYTHTLDEKKYFTVKYMHAHPQTRERCSRQKDGQTKREWDVLMKYVLLFDALWSFCLACK